MDQLVDLEKELQRVEKELAKNQKSLEGIEKKLSNPGFLAKAPENVVNGEKEKAEKLRALIAQLEESKARLQK
jgi:valyl-tRNA synthetase